MQGLYLTPRGRDLNKHTKVKAVTVVRPPENYNA